MAVLTPLDLQQMKRDGKKIAAAVVYEYQMAKICEAAGVDVLSVGDSLGRNVLGQAGVDDCTVEDMIPFARAVVTYSDSNTASMLARSSLSPYSPIWSFVGKRDADGTH